MTEIRNNEQKPERFGDFNPPISNCRGGIQGDYLLGSLTYEEIQEVKSIRIAVDSCNQNAMGKKTECPNQGEVVIAYYPEEVGFRRGCLPPEITTAALCLKTDCEYNVSTAAK